MQIISLSIITSSMQAYLAISSTSERGMFGVWMHWHRKFHHSAMEKPCILWLPEHAPSQDDARHRCSAVDGCGLDYVAVSAMAGDGGSSTGWRQRSLTSRVGRGRTGWLYNKQNGAKRRGFAHR